MPDLSNLFRFFSQTTQDSDFYPTALSLNKPNQKGNYEQSETKDVLSTMK